MFWRKAFCFLESSVILRDFYKKPTKAKNFHKISRGQIKIGELAGVEIEKI